MSEIKVRWDVEPDRVAGLECVQAGKEQFIAVVVTTIGPFDSYAIAEATGARLRELLPTKFEATP